MQQQLYDYFLLLLSDIRNFVFILAIVAIGYIVRRFLRDTQLLPISDLPPPDLRAHQNKAKLPANLWFYNDQFNIIFAVVDFSDKGGIIDGSVSIMNKSMAPPKYVIASRYFCTKSDVGTDYVFTNTKGAVVMVIYTAAADNLDQTHKGLQKMITFLDYETNPTLPVNLIENG